MNASAPAPHNPPHNVPYNAPAGGGVPPSYPYPPAPKRSWFARHKILTGLGVVILLALIIPVLGGGGGQSGSSATTPAQRVDAVPAQSGEAPGAEPQGGDPAEAEPPADPGITFPGMKSDDIVTTAGSTVDADGLQITATDLIKGDSVLEPTTCTTVTFVNSSSDSVDVSIFDFSLQDPNGAIVDGTVIGSDNILSSSTLIEGGTMSGDVCFDADLSKGGQYIVLYEPFLEFFSHRSAWVNDL